MGSGGMYRDGMGRRAVWFAGSPGSKGEWPRCDAIDRLACCQPKAASQKLGLYDDELAGLPVRTGR